MATPSSTTPSQVSHLATRLTSPSRPIILRTVEARDAASFSAILSAPESSSDPNIKPMDIATASAAIGRMRESASQPTVYDAATSAVLSGPSRVNMALILTQADRGAEDQQGGGGSDDDGIMIGLGGYGAIKDLQRDGRKIRLGDVGVVVDPAHRNKGYAAEAMRLAIDWAFRPVSDGGPQLDLVTITTLSSNTAMVKLADEKLGLKGRGVRQPSGEAADSEEETYYELTLEVWKSIGASKQ